MLLFFILLICVTMLVHTALPYCLGYIRTNVLLCIYEQQNSAISFPSNSECKIITKNRWCPFHWYTNLQWMMTLLGASSTDTQTHNEWWRYLVCFQQITRGSGRHSSWPPSQHPPPPARLRLWWPPLWPLPYSGQSYCSWSDWPPGGGGAWMGVRYTLHWLLPWGSP